MAQEPVRPSESSASVRQQVITSLADLDQILPPEISHVTITEHIADTTGDLAASSSQVSPTQVYTDARFTVRGRPLDIFAASSDTQVSLANSLSRVDYANSDVQSAISTLETAGYHISAATHNRVYDVDVELENPHNTQSTRVSTNSYIFSAPATATQYIMIVAQPSNATGSPTADARVALIKLIPSSTATGGGDLVASGEPVTTVVVGTLVVVVAPVAATVAITTTTIVAVVAAGVAVGAAGISVWLWWRAGRDAPQAPEYHDTPFATVEDYQALAAILAVARRVQLEQPGLRPPTPEVFDVMRTEILDRFCTIAQQHITDLRDGPADMVNHDAVRQEITDEVRDLNDHYYDATERAERHILRAARARGILGERQQLRDFDPMTQYVIFVFAQEYANNRLQTRFSYIPYVPYNITDGRLAELLRPVQIAAADTLFGDNERERDVYDEDNHLTELEKHKKHGYSTILTTNL